MVVIPGRPVHFWGKNGGVTWEKEGRKEHLGGNKGEKDVVVMYYMNELYMCVCIYVILYHFYPPSSPSYPFYIWNPLQNVCLLLHPLLLYIHVNKSTYKCNSLTPFSIACIYMLLWLSTWYWINYQGDYYWGRWMFPLSAIVNYTDLHPGGGSYKITFIFIRM